MDTAGVVHFEAAVFDMDGVVTRTADLHAAAWKELFDGWSTRHDRWRLALEPRVEFAAAGA